MDPEVSKYASQYLIAMIVGTYFEAQFDLSRRWLIQMKATWVPMISQLICTILHGFWSYLFIVEWQLHVYGAGLAMALSNIILVVMTTLL